MGTATPSAITTPCQKLRSSSKPKALSLGPAGRHRCPLETSAVPHRVKVVTVRPDGDGAAGHGSSLSGWASGWASGWEAVRDAHAVAVPFADLVAGGRRRDDAALSAGLWLREAPRGALRRARRVLYRAAGRFEDLTRVRPDRGTVDVARVGEAAYSRQRRAWLVAGGLLPRLTASGEALDAFLAAGDGRPRFSPAHVPQP